MLIKGLVITAGVVCAVVFPGGIFNGADAGTTDTHVVTDMAGRIVTVPDKPQRIVTLGSGPVINSFVFAMGKGQTLINDLPAIARTGRQDCCRFQYSFAPQISGQTCLEGSDWSLKTEALLLLKPDVVLTGSKRHIDLLEKLCIPTVYIGLDARGETNREVMALIGKVYGEERQSNLYIGYFDAVMRCVGERIKGIPDKNKVKVLYCNFRAMTQSSLTADWWIKAAGGINLGKNGTLNSGIRSFSAEHVLAWNPDIWIVSVPDEIDMVYRDTRFANITAVINRKVFSVPVGSIRWSHPTSEQPLGVLWAAKLFYPERFKDLDIEAEMKSFYLTFFKYQLTGKEIKEMLTGRKQ